ncbi:hypothetical protein BDZ94DRAFT_1250697 [Collybia nuda]|uniref:Uncharacterized protein n=1 Tax=Collybia nuda TaxID=64659 RepID=A0A9P5YDN7_9AGAR|nr:hypothetical protein BDZ94DRAFT_1250697 [Collybia nuda]
MEIEELRERISRIDHHFAESSLFKFYFLREIPRDIVDAKRLSNEERIRQGRDRVLIETLGTGTVGLPTTATPIFHSSLSPVPILHPSVLILTKLQRWCRFYTSSRPKTRAKSTSDKADIDYILEWLRENDILIAFDQYSGRSREDLLRLVRIFWDKKLYDGDEEFTDVMKSVLADRDFNDIMRAREEEGNLVEKALDEGEAALTEVARLETPDNTSKKMLTASN